MFKVGIALCCLMFVSSCADKSGQTRRTKMEDRGEVPGNANSTEKPKSDSPASSPTVLEPTESDASSTASYGLYVFDGTGETHSNKHVMAQLFDAAMPKRKEYMPGPNLLGSNTRSIIEAGKKKICEDWLSGKVDKIFLVGFSRGAMIAVAAAAELTRSNLNDSNPEKIYCANSEVDKAMLEGVSPEKRKPIFHWIGLLDAVDTLNYDLIDSVDGTGANCFHLAKKNEWEGLLTTKQISGCTKSHVQTSKKIAFISTPLSHTDLTTDQATLKTLIDQAIKSGMSFGSI
jgi:hypothetical protein